MDDGRCEDGWEEVWKELMPLLGAGHEEAGCREDAVGVVAHDEPGIAGQLCKLEHMQRVRGRE